MNTMNCINKIEQSQEIHADSSFINTAKSLTLNFTLTGLTEIPFVHVGSFSMHPCFAKFITTLLTYVFHHIYLMQAISQAGLITP